MILRSLSWFLWLVFPVAYAEADEWIQHKDPHGFTMQHPRGWSVDIPDGAAIRVSSADRRSFIVIQPFLLRERLSARQLLMQAPTQLASIFQQARIQKVESVGGPGDEAIASLAYVSEGVLGRAVLMCSVEGSSGMLYAIAAPEQRYANQRTTLVRILRSLSFMQPDSAVGSPSSVQLDFVRWHDPSENAFSLDVPRAWRVNGGLIRFAPTDTRHGVELVSPDGKIRVQHGDAQVPGFVTPTPMGMSMGLTEGRWYTPGYGVNLMVRRYVPGVYFVAEYVQNRFGQTCSGLTFAERRERPDFASLFNEYFVQHGLSLQDTVGEVIFTCTANGEPMRGHYFAATALGMVGADGGALWHMDRLNGYLASEGKADIAEAVLERSFTSFETNPQWYAMQTGIAAHSSQVASQTADQIASMMQQTWANRERSQADVARKWSNTTLGQTDVRDPQTGETWKVAAGHNYYWRRTGGGTVTGTQTADRPDIDFSLLERW